jgi:hypothetical protein
MGSLTCLLVFLIGGVGGGTTGAGLGVAVRTTSSELVDLWRFDIA